MSRLFINLYLDEDVSVLVAALVRAHGFMATTTLEGGLLVALNDVTADEMDDQIRYI